MLLCSAAILWQENSTLLSPYRDLAPCIVTASDTLITTLILCSFKSLLQKSTLLLLHWFNSPMNSESPNYEITDKTKGSLWTNSGILAAPADMRLDQQLILLIISHHFIYWRQQSVCLILIVGSLRLRTSDSLQKHRDLICLNPSQLKRELERHPTSSQEPVYFVWDKSGDCATWVLIRACPGRFGKDF